MINATITLDNVINPCELCKNKDTFVCKDCISPTSKHCGQITFGDKFSPDASQVDEYFIMNFYELLNMHTKFLSNLGMKVCVKTFEKDT